MFLKINRKNNFHFYILILIFSSSNIVKIRLDMPANYVPNEKLFKHAFLTPYIKIEKISRSNLTTPNTIENVIV